MLKTWGYLVWECMAIDYCSMGEILPKQDFHETGRGIEPPLEGIAKPARPGMRARPAPGFDQYR
jgi:hypothetical protein